MAMWRFNKVHEEDFLGWEAWLESMAREGYHAKKVGTFFTRFEEGEREEVRYHVDLPGKENSAMRKDLLSEKGFKHVGKLGKAAIFRREGTPEDPSLLSSGKGVSYARWLRMNRILFLLTLGFILLLFAVVTFLNWGGPLLLFFVEEPFSINVFFVLLYTAVLGFFSFRRLKACKEAFESGEEAQYKDRWEPPAFSPALQKMVLTVLISFFPLMGSVMNAVQADGWKARAEEGTLPVLLLEEMVEEEELEFFQVSGHGNLLAPMVVESFQVGGEAHLYTQYYELITEHLAGSIMAPLLRGSFMENVVLLKIDGLDEVYYSTNPWNQFVLARRGRQVVSWTSSMDLEEPALYGRILEMMDRGQRR